MIMEPSMLYYFMSSATWSKMTPMLDFLGKITENVCLFLQVSNFTLLTKYPNVIWLCGKYIILVAQIKREANTFVLSF